MQNILIPSDFSANAQKAAAYAISLFGAKANYTLVNSYEVPHSGATMLISIADILEKDSLQLLREEQGRLFNLFPDLKDNISVKTLMGAPSVAIAKLAEEADLVVMGTKGASGLKEVLVGSVASNTLNDVKCPVIAVPESADLTIPKKLLFAADDKSLMEGKLPDGMAEIAQRFDAEVLLLNVVPKGEISHVGNDPDHDRKAIGVFERVKHSFHFIEEDDVNKGIEAFMKDHQVDMLAMITRRNDLFSRLFGLSNTKAMMMHTHVPLVAFH